MFALRLSRNLRTAGLKRSSARPLQPSFQRDFTLLALESSADDTCAAVVTSEGEVLSNVVIKQNVELAENGGIHPYVAIHAHQQNMPWAIRRALDEAEIYLEDVDAIAYTRGPGMGGCLASCSNAAKVLGAVHDKPTIGVHHMQAHALTPLLPSLYSAESAAKEDAPSKPPSFPYLAVLVSGGHSIIVLVRGLDDFKLLAKPSDTAMGRAFDHVSKKLGLDPGERGFGAALEAFCKTGTAQFIVQPDDNLPEPAEIPEFNMPVPGQLQFGFGAFHSKVDRYIRKAGGIKQVSLETRLQLAQTFQTASVKHLADKMILALKQCEKKGQMVADIVGSGGVASNLYLREQLRVALDTHFPEPRINLVFPPVHLCTDNAVMIGWAAMHRYEQGDFDMVGTEVRSHWPLEEYSKSRLRDQASE